MEMNRKKWGIFCAVLNWLCFMFFAHQASPPIDFLFFTIDSTFFSGVASVVVSFVYGATLGLIPFFFSNYFDNDFDKPKNDFPKERIRKDMKDIRIYLKEIRSNCDKNILTDNELQLIQEDIEQCISITYKIDRNNSDIEYERAKDD